MNTDAHYVPPEEILEDTGFDIEEIALEPIVPACCSEGCDVEPDGECPHGFNSILIELGLI